MDTLPTTVLDTRRRTLALLADLDQAQWMGPRLPIVNPFGWEIGHIGWFQERWVLREALGRPPIRADGDTLWDSSAVAHATRWDLPLPDRAGTLAYVEEVLHQVLDVIRDPSPAVRYHTRYAMLHEAMHAEAFTYMRQTLGYPPPPDSGPLPGSPTSGDVEVPGGSVRLGAERDAEWAFDNEKWAHPVDVAPFSIARDLVTQGEFARFVADGGYTRRDLWDPEAPWWDGPVYWRHGERRHFDRWVPIEPDRAMCHVSWFEADAFARWAGRRLPSEVEWVAASDSGLRQLYGTVWQWTSTVFAPFPGFVADPYADYSAPWFGTRRVLRGSACATSPALVSRNYRNFFTPERRDVFAGFRTCAR